jgi:hypothetical protein
MPRVEYRLFSNNQPLPREQLDQIDTITVEQGMDMAWEGQLQIPLCTDAKGHWLEQNTNFIQEFNRIRVEVKVGDAGFVPLIDGPIVRTNQQLQSQPGQSQITVIVQDDSYYLNREDKSLQFENLLDHDIAAQLFQVATQIASTDIDSTPAPGSNPIPAVVQRGTEMQLLRMLAARQGLHAYVLPGDEPGASQGCFKAFPSQPDGLPDLVLLGKQRNLSSFSPNNNAERPANFRAYALNLRDLSVSRSESQPDSLERLGDVTTVERTADTGVQVLPPRHGDNVDLDTWVAAETLNASYSIEATGQVLGDCYTGVLSPYRVVTVKGAHERDSGTYQITRVAHTLNRSLYSQDFSLRRNGRSQPPASNNNVSVPLASASLAISFNVQGSIF